MRVAGWPAGWLAGRRILWESQRRETNPAKSVKTWVEVRERRREGGENEATGMAHAVGAARKRRRRDPRTARGEESGERDDGCLDL